MNPRQLRRLPGIGEGRALAIARARWLHANRSAPLLLRDIEGIGEQTEEQVREWLRANPPRASEP